MTLRDESCALHDQAMTRDVSTAIVIVPLPLFVLHVVSATNDL